MFVATKHVFCRDKTNTCLSRQKYFVATNIILSTTFVATKDVFCRYKTFVATKMIHMAVPANDNDWSNSLSSGAELLFICNDLTASFVMILQL